MIKRILVVSSILLLSGVVACTVDTQTTRSVMHESGGDSYGGDDYGGSDCEDACYDEWVDCGGYSYWWWVLPHSRYICDDPYDACIANC